jgi:amino acid permease
MASPAFLTGASIAFFTYIGFDSVSMAAEECRRPQRDLPIGIVATLVICTILYGSVSLVLTGIVNYQTLTTDSPVADALKELGYNRLRLIVTAGALMGMLSYLLVYQYGQARIWFAMSRDQLLPAMFSAVHKRFQTPHGGHPCRNLGHRHVRGAFEYWDAVCVRPGFGRCDRPAPAAAGTAALVPRADGAAVSDQNPRPQVVLWLRRPGS